MYICTILSKTKNTTPFTNEYLHISSKKKKIIITINNYSLPQSSVSTTTSPNAGSIPTTASEPVTTTLKIRTRTPTVRTLYRSRHTNPETIRITLGLKWMPRVVSFDSLILLLLIIKTSRRMMLMMEEMASMSKGLYFYYYFFF
jgi:hypothetical protein